MHEKYDPQGKYTFILPKKSHDIRTFNPTQTNNLNKDAIKPQTQNQRRKRKRGKYRCQHCNKPKEGHACNGIAVFEKGVQTDLKNGKKISLNSGIKIIIVGHKKKSNEHDSDYQSSTEDNPNIVAV